MKKQEPHDFSRGSISIDVFRKIPEFVGNWLVFLGVVICLTTIPAWAAEAPDSEKTDDEVVEQAEETPAISTEPDEKSQIIITDTTTLDADEKPVDVKVTKEVITGTSDEMERYEKTGITILIGNAKTLRHNEEGQEIGFLNADRITLKSDPETGETIEIIAVGNVEIRDQKIFATCDHAVMNNLTNIITLKDNVVVLQKADRLETKLFTLNRTTGKQTGVGDVKFKVTVTQATPTETPEESEEASSDNKDASATPSETDEKDDSSEKEKDSDKKSEGDSDKPVSEQKTTPSETKKEKKESESEKDKETEPTESEGTEPTESEGTEPTESEETEPTESEETESPEEKQ